MSARTALAGALAALALAGCGGSGGSDSTSPPATHAEAQPPRVIVETAEHGFDAARVYREASPGVVTIRSIFDNGAAEGCGFVLDTDGRIVTNAHVVTEEAGERREPAKAVFVEFPDRNVVSAKILGFDPFADVALLKVEPDGFALHPLRLGNDHDLLVGQSVAAIGSPFGEQQSLSVGVVSATDRSVKSLTEFQIEGAIQTDASINPGNSGGPLLDGEARVMGINQQIETSSGANDGVGFAVPVSAVKRSLAQLKDGGEAEYAYIGVSTQSLYPQLADKLGLDVEFGALVAQVVEGGPADKAGIKGGNEELTFQANRFDVGGDVIVSANGEQIDRAEDLGRIVGGLQPGETVELGIFRDGKEIKVDVDLEERPTALTQPQLP